MRAKGCAWFLHCTHLQLLDVRDSAREADILCGGVEYNCLTGLYFLSHAHSKSTFGRLGEWVRESSRSSGNFDFFCCCRRDVKHRRRNARSTHSIHTAGALLTEWRSEWRRERGSQRCETISPRSARFTFSAVQQLNSLARQLLFRQGNAVFGFLPFAIIFCNYLVLQSFTSDLYSQLYQANEMVSGRQFCNQSSFLFLWPRWLF